MNKGLAVRPAEERADDIGVDDAWERVALPGEAPDVVAQGLIGLLLAVLEIPRIARAYVRALKVADEHFPEVCPAADGVGGQELQPWRTVSPKHIGRYWMMKRSSLAPLTRHASR